MLMALACFPEQSLHGCHQVGGPAAQNTPQHSGEPPHPPSLDTCRFWGLQPLDEHAVTSGRQNIAGTCCTSHPQHPTLDGHRALYHHSSTGRGEIPQLHAGLESCCGTGLCRVPLLPLHHLPAPPCWVLLLHGGCSVVWCGSGPTPPPPAAPSPIKGPGSGCVGSRAPDTADGVCKVRLPQVCLPWPGLKPVQLEL